MAWLMFAGMAWTWPLVMPSSEFLFLSVMLSTTVCLWFLRLIVLKALLEFWLLIIIWPGPPFVVVILKFFCWAWWECGLGYWAEAWLWPPVGRIVLFRPLMSEEAPRLPLA